MFTYADPRACPGCRAPLTLPATSCGACGLSLEGAAPARVFASLVEVDHLVATMYAATADRVAVATAAPVSALVPLPAGSADRATGPTSSNRARTGGGLGAASVPRILLGLGALCLVVAAVVFLAVAWAALGIGGRTGVLVGLTAVAATTTAWLARRDLRAGTEAFGCVALLLLVLDLAGAWRAGWLGPLGDDAFLLTAGCVVALAAAAAARWAMASRVGGLLGAQVVGALAVGAASLGLPDTLGRVVPEGAGQALVALVLCAVAAGASDLARLRVLAAGSAAGAVGWWLTLLGEGLAGLEPLSVGHVWGDLAAWPLVAAATLAGATAAARRLPRPARVVAASVAVALATVTAAAAALDESAVRLALVELAVVAAFGVLALRLPHGWRWVCAAPSVVASLALVTGAVRLVAESAVALLVHVPWGADPLAPLAAPDVPWTWPLLMPAGVVGATATAATLLLCAGSSPRVVRVPAAALLMLSGPLALPWYGAPLALVVAALLVVAVALVVVGTRVRRDGLVLTGAATSAFALAVAVADPWLTAAVLAVLVVGAVAAEVLPPRTWAAVGACVAPVAGAALLWTVQHLAGVDAAVRPLLVLVVLGVAVVLLPRAEREVAAGIAAVGVLGASVLVTGIEQSWLAVHLTVAGVVAVVSWLVNDRAPMARVGLGLLTLAQWVRLEELGVGTVEAYTLPLALVLLVTGTVRLRRGDTSSTRALGPGLTLALLPSLLQVMVDPVDVRAVLLGLGCLVLVALGVWRGWSAPLVAGAVTVALVVLRQGTLAQVLPQWLLIGLVGVALTVVGVTWERRLVELRRVSSYVRSLR